MLGEEKSSSQGDNMKTKQIQQINNTTFMETPKIGDSRRLLTTKGKGKAILLCDIENLAYDFRKKGFNKDDVRLVHERVMTLVAHLKPYQVVATSHYFWLEVMAGWKSPNFFPTLRSGKDGADLALLNAFRDKNCGDRYETILIASGDGIFSSLAAELSSAGKEVITLFGRGGLAKKLELASEQTIDLNIQTPYKRAA